MDGNSSGPNEHLSYKLEKRLTSSTNGEQTWTLKTYYTANKGGEILLHGKILREWDEPSLDPYCHLGLEQKGPDRHHGW